jgi:Holliday junction resolvasome RuvABC ATP-dependent DNA helicase subunit
MNSAGQMSTIILIGGASGVGKTTLAEVLDKRGVAVYKKIHGIALDIAGKMGTSVKTALEQMDDYVIIEKFIALAREYRCVVSDLHFAIQPRADTTFLTEGKVEDENLLATEEYVPAFEVAELSTITDRGMALVPILITCDISDLIQRRSQDTTRIPRSLNRTIVQQECAAEMEIYLSITRQLGLKPQIFVNMDSQFDKLKDEVVSLLESKIKR